MNNPNGWTVLLFTLLLKVGASAALAALWCARPLFAKCCSPNFAIPISK